MDLSNFYMYTSLVLAGLVAIEQVLAQVPSLQSNSTFQLICNITNSAVEIGKKIFGTKDAVNQLPAVSQAPPMPPVAPPAA